MKTDAQILKEMKKNLEFKTQIIQAPKGWKQWYVYPNSDHSIKITWARQKRRRKK